MAGIPNYRKDIGSELAGLTKQVEQLWRAVRTQRAAGGGPIAASDVSVVPFDDITSTDAQGALEEINAAGMALGDLPINTYTEDRVLAAADVGCLARMNKSSPITLTLSADSGIAVGKSGGWTQWGTGLLTIQAGSGISIRSAGGVHLAANRYSAGAWVRISSTEYLLTGDLTA